MNKEHISFNIYRVGIVFSSICMALMLLVLGGSNEAHAHGSASKPIMLKVDGVGRMHPDTVQSSVNPRLSVPAMCFTVDLLDMSTGGVIGTATDCLSEMVPNVGDSGFLAIATTTFTTPEGSATVQGAVAVQPLQNSALFLSDTGQEYTHMSGAIGSGNAIIASTGAFSGLRGTSRLSGLLNMGLFTTAEGDPVLFNCLFELHLFN